MLVSQSEESDLPHLREGTLEILIRRPTRSFTCSGRLTPGMADSPGGEVGMLSSPEGMPDFRIHAGTGTVFDFNVHVTSGERRVPLPVGEYRIRYSADSSSAGM